MLTDQIATESEVEHAEGPTSVTPARADFVLERVKAMGADIFALKMLWPALLSRVGRLDPNLGSAIQQGFQDATDQAEHLIAWTEARDPCTSALVSIKRLHAAVLTDLRQADSQA